MRADAILFDLDGTLADTLSDIAAAANEVMTARGLQTFAADQYRPWVGEGARELIKRALVASGAGAGDTDEALGEFRARYAERLVVDTRPYPGIPELLDELAALGLRLAVLSNKPHPMTCRIVDEVFARWRFEACFGHRPEAERKPDPASALEIAATLGVPPARCAFVGDTGVDIETARGAGMASVAVAWGFREADELRAHEPDVILSRPADLLPWLRG